MSVIPSLTFTWVLRAAVYVLPSTLTSTRQVYFPESSCKVLGNLRKPLLVTQTLSLRDPQSYTKKHSVAWRDWRQNLTVFQAIGKISNGSCRRPAGNLPKCHLKTCLPSSSVCFWHCPVGEPRLVCMGSLRWSPDSWVRSQGNLDSRSPTPSREMSTGHHR